MKQPFDSVKDQYLLLINNVDELQKFIFEYADKFVLGLIGFSLSGIALAVSYSNDLISLIGQQSINWILIFLLLSVTSGILFRFLFFVFRKEFLVAVGYINISFFKDDSANYDANKVTDHTKIEDILHSLKIDFNEDHSEFVNNLKVSDKYYPEILHKTLKDRHDSLRNYAKRSFYTGHIFSRDTLLKAFNIKKKSQLRNIKTLDFNFIVWEKTISYVLLLSAIFFMTSMTIFVFSYITKSI